MTGRRLIAVSAISLLTLAGCADVGPATSAPGETSAISLSDLGLQNIGVRVPEADWQESVDALCAGADQRDVVDDFRESIGFEPELGGILDVLEIGVARRCGSD